MRVNGRLLINSIRTTVHHAITHRLPKSISLDGASCQCLQPLESASGLRLTDSDPDKTHYLSPSNAMKAHSYLYACNIHALAIHLTNGNFKYEDISTLRSCSPALEVLPESERPTRTKTVRIVALLAMTALSSSSPSLEVLAESERPTRMKTGHIVARLENTLLITSGTFLL